MLATQTVWQAKPRAMRIRFEGEPGVAVTAKDMALHWISQLGTGGAAGHAVEYAGSAVRALSMEGRMTLCNLSIEGGARFGMVAPDAVTLAYVKGRPMAPSGTDWDAAEAYWQTLHSDADASFDRDVSFDMAEVAFEISLGLTGVLTLWLGLMRVGEKGGVIAALAKVVRPFFHRIFPEIPRDHPVHGSIIMNFAANMLGLDNAATPLGLKAMQEWSIRCSSRPLLSQNETVQATKIYGGMLAIGCRWVSGTGPYPLNT